MKLTALSDTRFPCRRVAYIHFLYSERESFVMAKATKQKLNQVEALQQLLQPGRSYTQEKLSERVGRLTGRTVSERSLKLSVAKVRKNGVNVEATHNAKTGVRGYRVPKAVTAATETAGTTESN